MPGPITRWHSWRNTTATRKPRGAKRISRSRPGPRQIRTWGSSRRSQISEGSRIILEVRSQIADLSLDCSSISLGCFQRSSKNCGQLAGFVHEFLDTRNRLQVRFNNDLQPEQSLVGFLEHDSQFGNELCVRAAAAGAPI